MEKLCKHPIMFVGTGSDVGKSVITAAFCRIFLQDGYKPAPFKAQNMSLNSYPTLEGLEIGRAQVVQAEAAGIPCKADMNPVLLKPTTNQSSQVILFGKSIGDQTAYEYFMGNGREELFQKAMEAFNRLEKQYNPIVIEGAGSISEVNLWDKDITNMRVAVYSQAAVYLIADIDRGGVFGSVYGTIMLLPPEERRLVKGIIINKFRGDIGLFSSGATMLEELTGVPVVGIIPFYQGIEIEAEDSVILDSFRQKKKNESINIGVILLDKMSNFTDFDRLERHPEISLFYARTAEDLEQADIIIIPGSKNTISDLLSIRKKGIAKAILQAAEKGKKVIGICGGYQMLGEFIEDPDGVEGDTKEIRGLGLLPAKTIITKEKRTVQTEFYFRDNPQVCKGYEIHMGETEFMHSYSGLQKSQTVNTLPDGTKEGIYVSENCWGTYMHGIFDNEVVINSLLERHTENSLNEQIESHDDFKNTQYDLLADHVRAHVSMDYIYKALQE